jgi:ankyrin repeat protein
VVFSLLDDHNHLFVRLLLENGASPNQFSNMKSVRRYLVSKSYPNVYFAAGNCSEISPLLREIGADVNLKHWSGKTSLLLAVTLDDIHAAKILMDEGADPNICDDPGQSSLHLAILATRETFKVFWWLQFLLQSGALPDTQDRNGKTPLHLISNLRGNADTCGRILISSGAKIDLKDSQSREPVYYAALHRTKSLAKFMLENGASEANFNDGCRDFIIHGPQSQPQDSVSQKFR